VAWADIPWPYPLETERREGYSLTLFLRRKREKKNGAFAMTGNTQTPQTAPQGALQEVVEELVAGLPRWLRDIIENRLREILSGIVIVVLGTALWSGYTAYTTRQENQASAALALAMQEPEPKERIDAIEKMIRRYGNTPAAAQAFLVLGAAQRDAGQLEHAGESFETARKKTSGKRLMGAGASMGLGYLKEEQSDLAGAREAYQKAIDAKQGFENVALLDLARVETALGHKDEALKAYDKYIASQPKEAQLDYVKYQIMALSAAQKGSEEEGAGSEGGAATEGGKEPAGAQQAP
jgi:predicted negative regulator of RcsB-dependent stress response